MIGQCKSSVSQLCQIWVRKNENVESEMVGREYVNRIRTQVASRFSGGCERAPAPCWLGAGCGSGETVSMQRARSVAGPLRRAHPASGATWNVQVVRGKMSSTCLWHACRALSAGLLLMLLGGAMAVIGYYADTLSVDQEVRGNSTVSVKDEARGFHLNNLSYAGPIVMGFGGFIVVAACVMTFEARDSAAKVTPARPQALPRPLPRRLPCAAPARLDQLGVYRLPHVLPLPHALPLPPLHTHRHRPTQLKAGVGRAGSARFGSAPDLRLSSARAVSATALRRPLRRYAVSVDEPHHSAAAVSASAAESECGSQSSLAMDLHGSGACAGVTLRVRDNTRRRPLARQQRLRDDTVHPTPVGSSTNINTDPQNITQELSQDSPLELTQLRVETETRARSAPPPLLASPSLASPPLHTSPPPSPRVFLTPHAPLTPSSESCVTLTAATSAASFVTIVPSPDAPLPDLVTSEVTPDVLSAVTLPDTPVIVADVTSDVLLVVAPDVTLVVTPDIVSPVETHIETCITIEQTQQDSPSEEEKDSEVSEPRPPVT